MPSDASKYKEIYLSEASSHLKMMTESLLELEKNPNTPKKFQEIIRAVHTLKSLSATMNYQHIMELCHKMEDVFEVIRKKKILLAESIDLLLQCVDHVNLNLTAIAQNEAEIKSEELLKQLRDFVTFGKGSLANASGALKLPLTTIDKIHALEVKVERLDTIINLAEELLISKMQFDVIREHTENPELITAVESLGRLITDLQYHVMQIRLVPIDFIFNRFKRMARDLAKLQKKEINLQIEGGEIELDRLLLDEIGESMVHLLRNAIDHGLETPAFRKELNKPPVGTLRLSARQSKDMVLIEVSDDGRGLDLPALKALALEHNLLSQDATDEEITNIIFSTLSTKKNVTAVSGRGLGLSIVKQKIESIGGTIRVESSAGKGTTFFIEIPLSLAIINTLFVSVSGESYAIPLDSVERLLVVAPEDFKGLLEYEAILFDNDDIPVIRLSRLFGKTPLLHEKQPVVIIQKGGKRFGLVVDDLLATQEVVIKPLNKSIENNKYFSGAALVGSGEMILILDVTYLSPTRKYNLIHT